jgi:hypothetical protein
MPGKEFIISDADIEDLAKLIRQHGPVQKDAQKTFCGIWPKAKEGLELLRTILDLIPGIGVFAKAAIAIVLAAGDAANNALC